jgi:hypothetical protein
MNGMARVSCIVLAVLCAAGVAGGLLAEAAGPPAALATGVSGSARAPFAHRESGRAARDYPPLILKGKLKRTIAWEKLPTSVTWDGTKAGNINPSLRAKYRGQTLYKLVGLVDDGNPGSFNVAKARKGYKILFVCSDGYKRKIKSQAIVGKKTYIIAKLKNGQPLPNGEGPYRYVGGFIRPFYGKDSARMIVEVRLLF